MQTFLMGNHSFTNNDYLMEVLFMEKVEIVLKG